MIRPAQPCDFSAIGSLIPQPAEAENICYVLEDKHQIKGLVLLRSDDIIALSEHQTKRHNPRAAQKLLTYLQRRKQFLFAELTVDEPELLKLYHRNGFKIIQTSDNGRLRLCWAAGASKYQHPRQKGAS